MGADTPQNIMLKSWCVIWTLFPVQCGQSCFLRKDTDGWSVLIKASVAPYWHNRFHWELCKFKHSAQPPLTLSLLLTLNICLTVCTYSLCYEQRFATALGSLGRAVPLKEMAKVGFFFVCNGKLTCLVCELVLRWLLFNMLFQSICISFRCRWVLGTY